MIRSSCSKQLWKQHGAAAVSTPLSPRFPFTAQIHRGARKYSKQDLPQKKTLMHGNTANTLNIIFPLCSLTCCELLKTNLATSKITYSVYPLLQLVGPCRLTHASRDQLNAEGDKHGYEERKGLEAQGTFFVGIICLIARPTSLGAGTGAGSAARIDRVFCQQSPAERRRDRGRGPAASRPCPGRGARAAAGVSGRGRGGRAAWAVRP